MPALIGDFMKMIIEQPASKALRFRYECEGRSAGSIPGASSMPESKTFPEIQIVGYQGRAVVVVSCVTKDEPYIGNAIYAIEFPCVANQKATFASDNRQYQQTRRRRSRGTVGETVARVQPRNIHSRADSENHRRSFVVYKFVPKINPA
ncbi:hypothetical protein HUJ04_009181 [Dendroctonus ponderosae]|nr:hypothetical protein HUJ04_009181 [Dendroctonus ponderosae]